MSIVSEPNVSITILPATGTISNEPQKVLFVGQMLTGTATAGALTTGIGNAGEEDALFGKTSMIAQMVRQARTLNKVTQFDAIALADNGAGVAATGTVVVTGTATETGTFTLKIGSGANYAFEIAVTSGDTATAVGAAIDTAVALATNAPFTSANVTGTVTFTAANKGEVGNNFAYKVEGAVAGISIALTVPVNGATNPALTNIFDVIADERYQTIVWPNTYTLSTLTTELDARFNVSNDILDGVGITTQMDTFSNLQTAGNAENSQSLVILGNKILTDTAHKGGALLEFDDVLSSKLAALRALRLTPGASISQFVIATNGAKDAFGGSAIASLPYFNTPFPSLDLIDIGKGFSKTEVESLKTAGVARLGNNKTRTSIIADEIVTTRKTDTAGNPELTFKFLNQVDTSVNIREFFFNNLKAEYAQTRLTTGDLQPNRNMANQASIESFLDGLYTLLSKEDYVLTQAGETALQYFKTNRTVTLDLSDGSVDITMTTPIVTQLRTINATIQIAFSTEG
jgi:phage tail sheath gpL-like